MGLPKVKHVRVGPLIDVAACGVRGAFAIAWTQRYITCPECKAKYTLRLKTNRAAREVAARHAFFDTVAASKAIR